MSKFLRCQCVCLSLLSLLMLTLGGCGTNSSSTSANSTVAPTFSPGGGSYNTSQQVTIADATPGAVLYCTTDGTTPTTSSPRCAEPTTVFKTQFLQAIAAAPGKDPSAVASAAYSIDLSAAATPTFSPAGGTYSSAQQVTIADATAGVNIYYTLDGTVPTASSTLYTAPVSVSSSETLSAIAVASGYTNSPVASAAYTIGNTVPGVATPTFSLPSGNYPSTQMVTIADSTPNAVIYYTVDGTMPSTSSMVYSAPITVSQAEVINAIAVLNGSSSTQASAAYTIGGQSVSGPVPAPVFAPVTNTTLTAGQPVFVVDGDINATIYYTTDGTTPTSGSTQYPATGGIVLTIPGQTTIMAIAIDPAGNPTSSPVAMATFTLPVPAPTFLPAAGTVLVAGSTTVTIQDADSSASAAIYYTLDGSQPGTSISGSTLQYTAPFTLTTPGSVTINAIAVDTASSTVATVNYTVAPASVPVPSFSPSGGTQVQGQVVLIADADRNAVIYYTTNGTTPTISSTLYTSAGVPLSTAGSATIEAIAVDTGVSSAPATAAFTVSASSVGAPAIAPNGGRVTLGQVVTITESDAAAKVYYTVDGTTPSAANGTLYASGGFTLSKSGNITVQAIAIDGTSKSPVTSATFAVAPTSVPDPTFNPASGTTLTTGETISIADGDTGATIYYSKDGSTPSPTSNTSTKYSGPIALTASATIKAIAVDTGVSSNAVSATYTVPVSVTAPTISPAGGAQMVGQTVTITDTEANVTVYYTVNGGTPTASSTRYTGAITLSTAGTTTIKAIAVDSGGNLSPVTVATYTVTAPVGPSVNGVVLSGTNPVDGASVTLFAAGTTGYGSTPKSLGTATTNSAGAFAVDYASCPAAPGDLVYLVATEGNAGKGKNADLAMMTALGPCGKLSATASYTVNEATTVASAYALSAFMTSAPNVGAPAPTLTCPSSGGASCNYPGMSNAFATVNNLVNVATGAVLTHTPAYPADLAGDTNILNNSNVPTKRIDTLANILNACTASGGSCGLLSKAAPPSGGNAAANTLQAILNIAQNPGVDLSAVFTTSGPFTPQLSAVPNDWTLAVTFTGGGLGISPSITNGTVTYAGQDFTHVGPTQAQALAIDGNGNVWVSAGGYDYGSTGQNTVPMLAEFTPVGAPLTKATSLTGTAVTYGGVNPEPTGSNTTLTALAIDQGNNVWVGDGSKDGNLFEIKPNQAIANSLSLSHDLYSLTIDLKNNEWVSTQNTLREIHNGAIGSSLDASPAPGELFDLTFDSNGLLWGSDAAPVSMTAGDIEQVSTTNGSILFDAFPGGGQYTTTVADGNGNIYGCGDPNGMTLDIYNGSSSTPLINSVVLANGTRACGAQLLLDGTGRLFAVTNGFEFFTGASVDEFTTAGGLLSPAANGYTGTSSEEPPTINPDPNYFGLNGSEAFVFGTAAIDGSGNLWVLNPDTNGVDPVTQVALPGNALVEFIGIAAPVVTPLSTATANGALGTRP